MRIVEVHCSIELCGITKALLSTPQMQRLRQLKQLGTSFVTYIGTTHTRFEHSLGVMHLAEQLLLAISKRQPKLGITQKDIACVKIAGLLHDIGHGPYSHVYDGIFLGQLRQAEEKGEWLGHEFQPSDLHDTEHTRMDGWAHEDASLMMVDAMLKHLGLEIDESNLDAPLRQIGDGIDAKRFGIWDRTMERGCERSDDSDDESDCDEGDFEEDEEPLPIELVLTSRDWIFIKECIVGGPLPPKGVSIKKSNRLIQQSELLGRPDPLKEFLYDVVSNRHSGLDMDKADYLARDTLKAHGSNCIKDLLPKLIEKALVAWGDCNDPSSCFRCRNNSGRKPSPGARPEQHLMM